MLTTAYCMDDLHNSCIFVYNNKTGEFLKTLVLKDQKSHVGGITYDEKNKNIWVCHSNKDKTTGMYSLERITLSDLVKYATGKKNIRRPVKWNYIRFQQNHRRFPTIKRTVICGWRSLVWHRLQVTPRRMKIRMKK